MALPAQLFARFVAEWLPTAAPGSPIEPLLEQFLEQRSLEDVYIACALAHDVPAAISAFYVRDLGEAVPTLGDAEMDLLKRHHAVLRWALHKAFASLSGEERHLLRHSVKSTGGYPLGYVLLGGSPLLILERLRPLLQPLYDETQRHLQASLRLLGLDLESILTVLRGLLGMSISQIFEEAGALSEPSAVEGRKAVSPTSGA